jgi:hypothetical protein
MSFYRLTFYCAMIGGWAAFFGWLCGEALFMHRAAVPADWMLVLTAALCGMFIGGGLNFLAGIATGQLWRALPRLLVGLAVGFASGAFGSWFGNLLYGFLPRLLGLLVGWMIMGLCIGCVEGIYDLNWRKIRNGLLSGAFGGFVGGLLFSPLSWLIGSLMSSRAAGLVILGLCIGFLIGLAQVVLREAWLTVEEGFRACRQLVLGHQQIFLGTSEKAQLCFIAYGAKGVAPLHVSVARLQTGTYAVSDNGSQTGTFVNERRTVGWVPLRSGDVIHFGINKVRFNERQRPMSDRPQPAPLAGWLVGDGFLLVSLPTGKEVGGSLASKPVLPLLASQPRGLLGAMEQTGSGKLT